MVKNSTQNYEKTHLLYAIGLLFNFFSNAQCTVQGIYIHSFLADPTGTYNFDTDGDSSYSAKDEFIQICNGSSLTVQLNGFTLSDIVGVKHSFSSTDSIEAGECITVISDWQNTASMPVYFRDRNGGSVWNDSGDSIILSDGTNICNISYGSQGSTAEQDGCPTVFTNGTAYVDCSLSSAQYWHISIARGTGLFSRTTSR